MSSSALQVNGLCVQGHFRQRNVPLFTCFPARNFFSGGTIRVKSTVHVQRAIVSICTSCALHRSLADRRVKLLRHQRSARELVPLVRLRPHDHLRTPASQTTCFRSSARRDQSAGAWWAHMSGVYEFWRPSTCKYEGNPSSGGYVKHVVSPLEIRTPVVHSFVNADNQPDICMQTVART